MNKTRTCKQAKPPQTSAPRAKKQLTIRQRRFIDGKFSGKSNSQAAREAGYSKSVVRHADRIISDSPNMHAAIVALLDAYGISDDFLAKRVAEGLDATVQLRTTLYDKARTLVNFKERREMLELVLRLKGYLVDRQHVRREKTLEEILDASYAEERNQTALND
jgi:hypothetical protein